MIAKAQSNRRWWILVTVSLMLVMLNLDFTIVNLALPTIANEFNSQLSQMQWVITSYVIVAGMFTILSGRLSDIFGRRFLFLIGIFVFTITSLFAGLSFDEPMLVISRSLAGIGTAITLPLVFIIGLSAFEKSKTGFIGGILSAVAGISEAVGPSLGGVIIKYLGWRWIFFINIPIGIITIIFTYMFCVKDRNKKEEKIDYKGVTILVISLFLIMFSLNEWLNFPVIISSSILIVGALLSIALYFIDRKKTFPIIDFSLFKNIIFLSANLIRMFFQYGFFALLFIIVFYMQNIIGLSTLTTGLYLAYMTVSWGVVAIFAGRMIDKYGCRFFTILGTFLFVIAFYIFSRLSVDFSPVLISIAFTLIGIALGFLFSATRVGWYLAVDEKRSGVAMGIFNTTAIISGAIGVGITGAFLLYESKKYLFAQLQENNLNITSNLSYVEKAAAGSYPVKDLSNYFSSDMLDKLTPIVQNAFMEGFSKNMLICMFFSIIAFGLSYFLKSKKILN